MALGRDRERVTDESKVFKEKKTPRFTCLGATKMDHPKYSDMIKEALLTLRMSRRRGSSRQALLKYILTNFNVGLNERVVNNNLKMALKAGVERGSLEQTRGSGASGSFRLGKVAPDPARDRPKRSKVPRKIRNKTKPKKSASDTAGAPSSQAKPARRRVNKLMKGGIKTGKKTDSNRNGLRHRFKRRQETTPPRSCVCN